MNRRLFLTSSLALLATPALALTGQSYTPGLVKSELAAGRVVFLDFYAPWCSTCRSQERTIKALQAANPAYAENVSFITVDWDTYGSSDLARSLNIPRRSTLVVLHGDKELGRIVAGTGKAEIKSLMDAALAAATTG